VSVAPPPPPRIPLATYRLQLGPGLSFDDAAALVPYLAALGISDCYVSPFFETSSPASHGYDVSDHNRVRDELGGEAGLARFAAALRAHGLGLLLDVVPNHMGIAGNRNPWWFDVLENGPSSHYAPFFDIDWKPVKRELADKVLLPVLGAQYGAVLDGGQLRLELRDGGFVIRYYDHVLPVAPRSYGRILGHRIETLQTALGAEHPALLELKSLITWFVTIPPRTETDPERLAARKRETEIGRQRLAALVKESGDVRDFVDDNVRLFNGTEGNPESFDLLDALIDDQVYRVAFWRVAAEEINYRRFFDVNELAAIRMEEPEVFAEAHRLILRLIGDGVVTGLRIDHPDGLFAPAQYFQRLQRAAFLERARAAAGAGGRDAELLAAYDEGTPTAPARPFYIVAEKILAPGERVPPHWAVHGSTGYEFLNLLNGVFVDRSQARALEDVYARWVRERPSFPEIVYQSKVLIMETSMASELAMLAHRLDELSERHRSSRDFTLGTLTRALREIIAAFPIYRTYVGDGPGAPTAAEQDAIARAIALARRRAAYMDPSIYDWIQEILTLRVPPWASDEDRRARTDWVMRFQQTTGPVTAKGYEDTALYRYFRLVSLNEVGGDPARFGTALAEFHAAMEARQRETPHALSATATHDTKRGEDVRARINVLSEIPREWRTRVGRWQRLNRRHRIVVDGQPVPGPAEEYLLYQTLVGAWPIDAERLRDYVRKAIREAKVATSWINPNRRYDEAMLAFAETIVDRRRSREFLRDFVGFQATVARFGRLNSLAQTLVKITAPGVPDFYQGTELWDLSLVDPDNRRPVDFARRRRALDELAAAQAAASDPAALAQSLLNSAEDGRVKLFVTRHALAFRRRHAELFTTGAYRALEVDGPLAEHVYAFARIGAGSAVVVVPRLLARRGIDGPPIGREYWGEDTRVRVPADVGPAFTNALTGERVTAAGGALAVDACLASFPAALLGAEAA
jgi:(1->4)-alpha-D-glucan 1-alpha-D-glucosylmutase